MSLLNAFNTQLIQFFDELCSTFPEDKEIKMATEAVKGAKKVNPRLILDLFVNHVYNECSTAIYNRDIHQFRQVAQRKISTQFNEMISALAIFDKYWETMGDKNRDTIWQYMKVLCILSEKAKVTH
jgi:hypothetical protein